MNRQTLISFYFLLYHIHYHISNAVVELQPSMDYAESHVLHWRPSGGIILKDFKYD